MFVRPPAPPGLPGPLQPATGPSPGAEAEGCWGNREPPPVGGGFVLLCLTGCRAARRDQRRRPAQRRSADSRAWPFLPARVGPLPGRTPFTRWRAGSSGNHPSSCGEPSRGWSVRWTVWVVCLVAVTNDLPTACQAQAGHAPAGRQLDRFPCPGYRPLTRKRTNQDLNPAGRPAGRPPGLT